MTGRTTAWSDPDARPATPPGEASAGVARPGVPLVEALGVGAAYARRDPAGPALVVSIVGAGGKTTLAHALADELAEQFRRVVITTTTRMSIEPGLVTNVRAAVDALDGFVARGAGGVLVAGMPGTREKFTTFGPQGLAALRDACDVLIVEADGSRRLPFKVPAAYEPVVPEESDLLLLVLGLSSIGQPLDTVCCRAELAHQVLGEDVPAETLLDVELAGRLATAGYLSNQKLAAWIPGRCVTVLNQADDEDRWRTGHALASRLAGVRVVLTTRCARQAG
ncbi:MAG: selenium cofactor biosynthesis protein YqeC [Dermatophilaceae bacterium]